jgi:hypothetical protein
VSRYAKTLSHRLAQAAEYIGRFPQFHINLVGFCEGQNIINVVVIVLHICGRSFLFGQKTIFYPKFAIHFQGLIFFLWHFYCRLATLFKIHSISSAQFHLFSPFSFPFQFPKGPLAYFFVHSCTSTSIKSRHPPSKGSRRKKDVSSPVSQQLSKHAKIDLAHSFPLMAISFRPEGGRRERRRKRETARSWRGNWSVGKTGQNGPRTLEYSLYFVQARLPPMCVKEPKMPQRQPVSQKRWMKEKGEGKTLLYGQSRIPNSAEAAKKNPHISRLCPSL